MELYTILWTVNIGTVNKYSSENINVSWENKLDVITHVLLTLIQNSSAIRTALN